jgi:DNA repair protein RecN (Recombination protein N)
MSKNIILKSLNLINFATFDNVLINFDKGFNAIIGETGSGKSLILEALELILGARADKKIVRKNCEFSTVEAVFNFEDENVKQYFDQLGYPCDSNEMVVKRIIYKDGQGKCYLNYQSCNVGLLNSVSRRFIDLVGQFENQKLLNENYQLSLLDNYSNLNQEVHTYQRIFDLLNLEKSKLELLLNETSQREQKIDYLRYQLDEIHKCNLSEEEEANLNIKKFEFQNREQKLNALNTIITLISESSEGDDAFTKLKVVKNIIDKNSKLFSHEIQEGINNLIIMTEDLSYKLNKAIDLDSTEVNIDDIIEKLDLYTRIKKKFGPTLNEVKINSNKLESELDILLSHEQNLNTLTESIQKNENVCKNLAEKLHTSRIQSAINLSKELTKIIQELKMVGATVKLVLERTTELNQKGNSSLQFYCQTNPGEGFHKINEIASGGELSRILLALRQLLASKDSISVFLFDEIDTGLGGETALCIGKSLKSVAKNSQVIAITHLPQIASNADKLILVSKEQEHSIDSLRTFSHIREIHDLGMMKKEIMAMTPLN